MERKNIDCFFVQWVSWSMLCSNENANWGIEQATSPMNLTDQQTPDQHTIIYVSKNLTKNPWLLIGITGARVNA